MTTPSKIPLGFLIREPPDVYHAKAANHLSSHWLAEFRKCPLLYHRKRLGLIPERESAAFLVGRAAHTLILEGRARYESAYAVGGPINPKTGKPYGSATKAFTEWAERSAKPVLSDDQAALVEQMAAAVAGHSFAGVLLAEGTAEGVVRCRLHEHDCQARIDWLNSDSQRGIADLRTADNLDSFEFDIRTYGYVHQLAFYRAPLAEHPGHVPPAHVIASSERLNSRMIAVSSHALTSSHSRARVQPT
ncbi:MAG: PD-(D/E)XK nuclease-like domain-containing protein [Phycisphaeraceae bacterium]|nr:PD-(D/E)XK nuclease-like domain-containing protein [Phycisphaeraceae bacterium]